jgi:hypothetical protein
LNRNTVVDAVAGSEHLIGCDIVAVPFRDQQKAAAVAAQFEHVLDGVGGFLALPGEVPAAPRPRQPRMRLDHAAVALVDFDVVH